MHRTPPTGPRWTNILLAALLALTALALFAAAVVALLALT
jgi:hypothetical protein